MLKVIQNEEQVPAPQCLVELIAQRAIAAVLDPECTGR